jgi:FkbM family methyltransferase
VAKVGALMLNNLRALPYDKNDAFQFLAFASTLATRSTGQLFQDLWALWESGGKRGGYFVEFGAANGVTFSNSYFLEREMGWTGALAEPNPEDLPSIMKNRSCHVSNKCVHWSTGDTIEFLTAGELSRIASELPGDKHERRRQEVGKVIEVETITLNDLLVDANAPRAIDYMSIDTEGSEFGILEAFDFGRWNVSCFSVEHNSSPLRESILKLMNANGYRRKWPQISAFDDWYVRQ